MNQSSLIQVGGKIGSFLSRVVGAVLQLAVLVTSLAIILIVAKGGLWLADKLLPVAEWLAGIGLAGCVATLASGGW